MVVSCFALDVEGASPVMKYADDTLVLLKVKGTLDQVRVTNYVLWALSHFSGLHIDFNKSTFVPINMTAAASVLSCPFSSLPYTYLLLPLSMTSNPKS